MTATAEVLALVRLYREYGRTIADLEEARNALRVRVGALVPVGFSCEVDGKAVAKLPPARSFHLGTAVALAGVAGIPVRELTVIDTSDLRDRLKAVGKLDDAMLAGNGSPRVVIG